MAVGHWRGVLRRGLLSCGKSFSMTQLGPSVAALVSGHSISCDADVLEHIAVLAEEYMHDLVATVKKFSEIQRRTRPSLNDIRYAFALKGIDYSDLYIERLRSSKLEVQRRPEISRFGAAVSEASQLVEETDANRPFFTNETYDITNLVPRNTEKPIYVPSYLPEFPPDYTFKNTPDYNHSITDMEQLRVKLVEESRLSEKSLYNLISQDQNNLATIREQESDDESLMSLRNDIRTPSPRFEEMPPPELPEYADDDDDEVAEVRPQRVIEPVEKRFDVVEYAKKRLQMKQRKEQAAIAKIQKRQNNIFIQAEKYISPYATEPASRERYTKVLQDELERTIKLVKVQEAQQTAAITKTIEDRLEKEKQREEERKAETIEFGFNFHSDSDSEAELDDIVFGDVVFGDQAEPQPQFPQQLPQPQFQQLPQKSLSPQPPLAPLPSIEEQMNLQMDELAEMDDMST